ncbi:hypothetical protein PF005_g26484 [Phytophthora fragariae]|uniref:Uncharacterized protein n=1 Tax=Phytophthora fragariae TaxID=53985 RepID=A0A6A3QD88_9STRA|nr:hypothetical protein PF009_g26964 [Phytophthora fragariae]KAE9007545.1 hypothetical protein PF011_g11070 [Phytophthora fragariae]KAE9073751.1 hypothetical protein PF006_g28668 [Phytophthora fragariae]KAE9109705.1 hypothetical protein PF007_g12133 [Phytophthora fragariae]KAE9172947.1 hypothetical protein PF005_g26484 [Phytophthora fragariae]
MSAVASCLSVFSLGASSMRRRTWSNPSPIPRYAYDWWCVIVGIGVSARARSRLSASTAPLPLRRTPMDRHLAGFAFMPVQSRNAATSSCCAVTPALVPLKILRSSA